MVCNDRQWPNPENKKSGEFVPAFAIVKRVIRPIPKNPEG